ncbi:glyoxalase family protein [Halomicrobium zhouii]|uniref:Glyoxalase family protein n=1 Tax=Halomicrobium zhouii TaxID=767519 RepID=A0A1I6KZR7_9EURY|nr:VOC family protein [Halomicrobium zhouii]SFR96420.1 glyoxalase family protein [Halomicrobium zhouii]
MRDPVSGLHHVSAIAGDPQANVDCYTDVLGLRFVKRTVNFDYEFMYHLYYGSESADPGTLLTFFPYQRGEVGRVGQPQPSAVALAVPEGSSEYWYDRLAASDEFEVVVDEPVERFGDAVVRFRDHDGVRVELVESDSSRPPATDAIPAEYAVRGLDSVTLRSTSVYHTAATLEVFGFDLADQEGDRVRYEVSGESEADPAVVDILDSESEYGKEGIGTIHHVAFGAGDVPLSEWRDRLFDAGLEPTRITDRRYFESVYARDPGGILFEVATTEPGFTVDEDLDELGSSLQLPPQYEGDREMLESQLPEIVVDRD